jgi:peptide chain release factor 2
LRTLFDVLKLKEELLKKEREMQEPNFWNNQGHARKIGEEVSALKKEITEWDHLSGEAKTLTELTELAHDAEIAKELEGRVRELDRAVSEYEIRKLFSGKYDKGNAIFFIFSGAGGKDAEDWSAMLRRMFERWAEKKGFRVTVLHEHFGEFQGPAGWGIKNVTLKITGAHAYGLLKKESGVHRLVRISPFSSQSLRHTSFSLVEVMPEFVAPEEVVIKPEELKIEFFRSSGPGGQNVNKRETAVRVTHIPTKISVAAQSERTQERNRDIAVKMLAAKLYQEKLREQEREEARLRGQTVAVEWGSQIRSYVLHPYQMVKDHRTEHETSDVRGVLDGELDEFIEAELRISN